MAHPEKELEDRLREVGNKLATPPSAVEELLPLLDQTESLLSRVEQSPSQSMSNALRPAMKALISKELLGHSDMDVKVAVASCVSEITRITAPDAPYDDDLMKEVFQRIVEAFEKLDDISSRSYAKRVSILETVAKVRSCVVMLDLECDALILEMFRHFLKTVRSDHSENVFSSMETIMTLVIEESEDISSDLLSFLLHNIKKEDNDILPIARSLVEKVISNCIVKLKPYIMESVQSAGVSLSDYSNVIASLCRESSDGMENNDLNASGEALADDSKLSERTVSDELPQGSAKPEQEAGCPEEVGTAREKSPRPVTSNGAIQIGHGEADLEPTSPKQKLEHSRRDQSKGTDPGGSDNLELMVVKSDDKSDLNMKKIRGRKSRSKEADSAQSDGPSGNIADSIAPADPEKKDELQPPSGSDNGAVASPNHSESPDTLRPKRGRPPGSKVSAKRGGSNAGTDQSASKGTLRSGQSQDKAFATKDADSKKEVEGIGDSEGKSSRRSGKKVHAESAAADDTRANAGKKGVMRKVDGESSRKKLKSGSKLQKEDASFEKDEAAELSLKEMVLSPKSLTKAKGIDNENLEESAHTKSKRKRSQAMEETSDTPTGNKKLDEGLIGSRIKVWWPDDKKFYDGLVDSFDPVSRKHKVVYDDGDVEILLLRDERWEFIEGGWKTDAVQAKGTSRPDASLELPRNKRTKSTSSSGQKQLKTDTPLKSVSESGNVTKRKGRPRGGVSNLGTSSGDDSAKASSRSKEKAGKYNTHETPRNSGKLKKESGSKLRDDSLKMGDMSKDDTRSKDDTPITGSKSKDDRSSRKSKDDTPKNAGKTKDDVVSSGNKLKSKSSEDTPRAGRKPKGTAPTKMDVESKANGTSEKGKSRAQESEAPVGKVHSDSVKAQESEASTGKMRKRKSQS